MHIVLLIPEYFIWHYTTALKLTLNIVMNFVWFTYHFFSMPVIVKNLSVGVLGKSSEGFFVLIFNLIVRAVILIFGSVLCVVVMIFGLLSFLAWLVMPLAVVFLVFKAFTLLI